jgi:hypothetical protein
MSKPNEGFDLDSYDFTEYASALDGENPSSTDCDMESESEIKYLSRQRILFTQ